MMGENMTYEDEFKAKFEPEPMEIAAAIGMREPGGGGGNLFCQIIAWQDLSTGEIHEEQTILIGMGKRSAEHREVLKKKSIVTIRVHKSIEGSKKGFRMVDKIANDKIFPELKMILKKQVKLQKQKLKEDARKEKSLKKNPVYYDDEVLGKFKMDSTLLGFNADIVWCGDKVMLSFKNGNEQEIQNCITFARELFEKQDEWDKRIRRFAAEGLTGTANDWNEDHEISEDEFYNRNSLEFISLTNDGGFTFWLSDDDMFRGHTIEVCGNMEDGPTDVDIVG